MPGHKGKTGFERDVTELEGTDDLHNPTGAIKEANDRLARIYGYDYASMVTCGSTVGVMAMLSSAKTPILMGRDAHKSAINSACLFNLACDFVQDVSARGYMDRIKTTSARTLYLTYPSYLGSSADFTEVIKAAKGKGMAVVADCAHGAHFPFSHRLPQLPDADMMCVSFHKTMGALAGGAAVFAKDRYADQLRDNLFRLHTTSPSYLIMESIDTAVDFMVEKADVVEKWIDECIRVKKMLGHKSRDTDDPTRITLSLAGHTGYELYDVYKKSGIMAEMADLENLVFITSPYDISSIQRIAQVDISPGYNGVEHTVPVIGKACKPISYVKGKSTKKLRYSQCEGMISYLPLGAYPPGIACVLPGEIITRQVIEYFEDVLGKGGRIFNMEGEMIQVIQA